ncbi:uncharacterized protein L3040_009003 [Drepanopeziza brunnea f. sp. 'multigermtubi']|uniref:uncharacterized protein n=1 Tax=Drepanopeziza brunnea f. sp. 'multigermtubi' TaxID=698441 RepID=UPI0023993114|nr:hypothetical protein L3040_009003 [Drepanopeziza brunnea f. sp. 'multigermtubi']
MAPKNLPPAAKQAKILAYFQESMSVFTLKELEKNIAAVASVNQMQVKEYLQAIQDENLIRVEKIGSGNWYWCFTSDAKMGKERMLAKLSAEEEGLLGAVRELEAVIEAEVRAREDGDGEWDGDGQGEGVDRKSLLEMHARLMGEMEGLDRALAAYSDHDPEEVMRKALEVKRLRESAVRWTDNLESLESFLHGLTDRERVTSIMEAACGAEYVAGEGLTDL